MPRCNFDGTVATFAATGVVRARVDQWGRASHPASPGVQISFTRVAGRPDLPVPAPVVTDANRGWQQHGFQAGGAYSATASKTGFGFAPTSVTVRADVSSEFTGGSSTSGASGRIVTLGGAPDPAVTIHVDRSGRQRPDAGREPPPTAQAPTPSPDSIGPATTGSRRSNPVRPSIRPVATSCSPRTRSLSSLASFTRTTNPTVSGQVLTTGGAGLVGAVITFTRTLGAGAVPLPVTTTSNGEYHAAGLDTDTTYIVTATRDDYSSAPTPAARHHTRHDHAQPHRFPDLRDLRQSARRRTRRCRPAEIADMPGIPGEIVSFHPSDVVRPLARPSSAELMAPFHQRGFEVGSTFVAQAFAAGYVASQLSDILGILGNIGTAIAASFGGAPTPTSPTYGPVQGDILKRLPTPTRKHLLLPPTPNLSRSQQPRRRPRRPAASERPDRDTRRSSRNTAKHHGHITRVNARAELVKLRREKQAAGAGARVLSQAPAEFASEMSSKMTCTFIAHVAAGGQPAPFPVAAESTANDRRSPLRARSSARSG